MKRALLFILFAACDQSPKVCPIGDDIDEQTRLSVCAAEIEVCEPSATIGRGSGGAFRAFDPAEVVSLDVAPQGGFGVSIKVRTVGLIAGDDKVAEITLDVEMDGNNVGTHTQPVSLLCQETGEGEVFGVVVGFDPSVYSTNDALTQLDGKEVLLKVILTDEAGTETTAESTVTINVGG